MKYKSTRGIAPEMSASGAIIKGIAADRGLYVPEEFPKLEAFNHMAALDYKSIAAKVLAPYLSEFSAEELKECIDGAYDGKYSVPEIVPVRKAGGAYFLELYHGPTAAFKDMALQLMPRLLVKSMEKNHEDKTVVILVSTSGDTGTAALKGFENVPGTQIVVFFPDGAVSPVQERQMRTASGSNAHVFSILGNFDDAQTTQKQILSDDVLLKEMEAAGFTFSAANSMNVGRLIPQIVYYVWGYLKMVTDDGAIFPGDPINICVPSGNFGNILSAYYAMRMGVPVKKLICASNKNKVLTDFMNTGIYDANREFFVTNSPSMDILISSNLERLLYHLADEDAAEVRSLMDQLSETGRYQVSEKVFEKLSKLFAAGYADEDEINAAIGDLYAEEGYLMDTHTAVGYKVWKDYAERTGDYTPTLIASTASPYKFAASIAGSIGIEPGADEFDTIERLFIATGYPVPSGLAGLKDRPVVHKEAIKREDMKERVKKLLGL
ncbi:MAG: threonine synthase [Firmicutes bacterium]|nr:threonine synthase [Bacillota bacterium]